MGPVVARVVSLEVVVVPAVEVAGLVEDWRRFSPSHRVPSQWY